MIQQQSQTIALFFHCTPCGTVDNELRGASASRLVLTSIQYGQLISLGTNVAARVSVESFMMSK